MSHIILTWGKSNQYGNQGYAIRSNLDPRYWTVSWSELWDTLERDGFILWYGDSWRSWNGKTVLYPSAVTDDYGNLVPANDPN